MLNLKSMCVLIKNDGHLSVYGSFTQIKRVEKHLLNSTSPFIYLALACTQYLTLKLKKRKQSNKHVLFSI